ALEFSSSTSVRTALSSSSPVSASKGATSRNFSAACCSITICFLSCVYCACLRRKTSCISFILPPAPDCRFGQGQGQRKPTVCRYRSNRTIGRGTGLKPVFGSGSAKGGARFDAIIEPFPAKAIKSIKPLALQIKSPALGRGDEASVLTDQQI